MSEFAETEPVTGGFGHTGNVVDRPIVAGELAPAENSNCLPCVTGSRVLEKSA